MARCSTPKVDKRVETILINPRLVGLPMAKQLSMLIFIIIIGINVGLSYFLKELNEETVCTAESALNGEGTNCEEISYTEQVGYRFNNDNLFIGSKAYLAVDILAVDSFSLNKNYLSGQQLNEVNTKCDEKLLADCIQNISFITLQDENTQVKASIVFGRTPNDQLWYVEINEDNIVEVYFPDPNKVLDEFVVNANLRYHINGKHVANFDVTLIPAIEFTNAPKEQIVSSVVVSVLKTLVTQAGRNDLFGISLSTRFARCCRQRGLSVFEYFGLLFDYTFIIEGALTVMLALGVLKLLGFQTVPENETRVSEGVHQTL